MSTTVSHPIPTAQAQAIADLTGYEDAATLRWQQACVQAANTLTALPNGIKLKVGNMVLMYTMRDVDDLKLQRRATMSLPWLMDILHGCEANLAARQEEAERTLQQVEEERQAQARSLDEQIAAAVAAAMQAQANGTPPPRAPQAEPTTDTDPSWCAIHRCTTERRSNERGSWYSHRLSSGAYCKGE
jgi:hypothetical protein